MGASQPGLPVKQIGGLDNGAIQAAKSDWNEMDRARVKIMDMIKRREILKFFDFILFILYN
jgi:hypothetical protein